MPLQISLFGKRHNNRWVLQCGPKCHYLRLCQTNAERELDEK